MISLQALFKSSMIYGFGSALVRMMTFLLVPLYTNASGAQGDGGWWGHYVLIFPIIGILRACYSHGAGDSFLKLYSEADNKKEIVSTYIIHILITTTGISALLLGVHFLIPPLQDLTSLMGLLQAYFYYIIIIILECFHLHSKMEFQDHTFPIQLSHEFRKLKVLDEVLDF